MKAIFAGVVAAFLISATAAPSFAASTSDVNNCVFKDSALCATESLSPTTGNDEPPVRHLT